MGRRICLIAAWLIVAIALAFSALYCLALPLGNPYRPDYSVFWTASHVALTTPQHLYDSTYMTAAQSWLVDPARGPRPFAYPPSALLAFLPFSGLSFWQSFAAWNLVSLGLFIYAAEEYAKGWCLGLSLVSLFTIISLASGQTSLLIGSAILWGVSRLDDDPIMAGIVLGFAAAVKPQALVLAPLILNRKATLPFLVGGGTLVIMSVMAWPRLWLDWINAFPDFFRAIDQLHLQSSAVSPAGIAARLELDETTTLAIRIAGAVAGVALAIWSRNRSKEDRVIGLALGSVLCSPYAMRYDLAVLMPIAAAALFSGTPRGLLMGLPLVGVWAAFGAPLMAIAALRTDEAVNLPSSEVAPT